MMKAIGSQLVARAALAAALAGFGFCALAAELDPVKVPASANPQVRGVIAKSWPKVLEACPGLTKFRADLAFKTVEDNLSFAPANAQRIEVVYQVRNDPKVIPAQFGAMGHSCYFAITPDGGRVHVDKRPCASLCKGSEQNAPLAIELR